MPTDLEYFYESKLDRTNIKDFYESLPNHLQSKFKQCNHTKIIWEMYYKGIEDHLTYVIMVVVIVKH